MQAIFKWLLDYLVSKIVPMVVDFIRKSAKKAKINKEVNDELDEIEKIKKEAGEWVKKNPGKPLPKEYEDRLRRSASRRVNGLHR